VKRTTKGTKFHEWKRIKRGGAEVAEKRKCGGEDVAAFPAVFFGWVFGWKR